MAPRVPRRTRRTARRRALGRGEHVAHGASAAAGTRADCRPAAQAGGDVARVWPAPSARRGHQRLACCGPRQGAPPRRQDDAAHLLARVLARHCRTAHAARPATWPPLSAQARRRRPARLRRAPARWPLVCCGGLRPRGTACLAYVAPTAPEGAQLRCAHGRRHAPPPAAACRGRLPRLATARASLHPTDVMLPTAWAGCARSSLALHSHWLRWAACACVHWTAGWPCGALLALPMDRSPSVCSRRARARRLVLRETRRALLGLQDGALASFLRLWASSARAAVRVLSSWPAEADDETTRVLCLLGGGWSGGTTALEGPHPPIMESLVSRGTLGPSSVISLPASLAMRDVDQPALLHRPCPFRRVCHSGGTRGGQVQGQARA
jgi:hypothetical protein